MNLVEAVALARAGERVTCHLLPKGAVLKSEVVGDPPAASLRVVFEATGSGFNFIPSFAHQSADWRKVEGWVSYAT